MGWFVYYCLFMFLVPLAIAIFKNRGKFNSQRLFEPIGMLAQKCEQAGLVPLERGKKGGMESRYLLRLLDFVQRTAKERLNAEYGDYK